MLLRKSLTAFLLLSFISPTVWSATVTMVKGNRLLVDLEGADAVVGDEFFLINPESSKKSAIIRVRQVKNGKAVADLLKGRAAKGYGLQAKGPSRMSAPVPEERTEVSETPRQELSSRDKGILRILKNSWGVLGGFAMNTMDAQVTNRDVFGTTTKTPASMKGTGMAVGGFYDHLFTPEMVGHASVMYEQFSAKGTASVAACTNSTDCTVDITYLSLYGLGKYYFKRDQYRYWAGGGLGYLLAIGKSSTALNASKISANPVIVAAGGFDYQISRRNYVPVSLEYNYFMPSSDVTANQIFLKAGWAWNF